MWWSLPAHPKPVLCFVIFGPAQQIVGAVHGTPSLDQTIQDSVLAIRRWRAASGQRLTRTDCRQANTISFYRRHPHLPSRAAPSCVQLSAAITPATERSLGHCRRLASKAVERLACVAAGTVKPSGNGPFVGELPSHFETCSSSTNILRIPLVSPIGLPLYTELAARLFLAGRHEHPVPTSCDRHVLGLDIEAKVGTSTQ